MMLSRAVGVMALALAVVWPAAIASDPESARDKRGKQTAEASGEKVAKAPERKPAAPARDDLETIVITNDLLEARYGGGGGTTGATIVPTTPPPSGQAAAEGGRAGAEADPLKALQDAQAAKQGRMERIAQARQAVAEAEKRLRELEQRRVAISNPFLPRPQVDDEERADWDKMDGQERVKKTEADIEAARQALEEARSRLRELESGS